MQPILDEINKYANVILVCGNCLLVIVTTAYVILTRQIVEETRKSREAQTEPQLVASFVFLGGWFFRLRIWNAGGGAATNIEADISFEPSQNSQKYTWRHPVVLAGHFETVIMPFEDANYLDRLAKHYDQLVITLRWHSVTTAHFE